MGNWLSEPPCPKVNFDCPSECCAISASPVPGSVTRYRRYSRYKMEQAQKKIKTDTLSRSWCFTAFEEESLGRLMDMPCRAIVVAEEETKEGKKHFQGYIRFTDKVRFSWWKNQFPTFHVEPRKGTEEQAWQYIADVESYLKTPGAHEKTQGRIIVDRGCSKATVKQDNVTLDVLDMLEARCPRWQIYRAHRLFYFHNGEKIRKLDDEIQGWVENGRDYKKEEE